MPKVRSLAERFNEKVDRSTTPDGCWQWTACRDRLGYGFIGLGGRQRSVLASRVALELALGRSIRPGLCALHGCDNPSCVRVGPGHVYEGTLKQNTRDMIERGRHSPPPRLTGEAHPNARLTDAQVAEIRASAESGVRIAARLGVSRWHVYEIRQGRARV